MRGERFAAAVVWKQPIEIGRGRSNSSKVVDTNSSGLGSQMGGGNF